MKLDGIREKVFLDRYSLKDKAGKPMEKTPDEMWKRVAKELPVWKNRKTARNGKKNSSILHAGILNSCRAAEFWPVQEPVLTLPYYINCFVIPNPPDSRGGIMANLTQMIEIMAHGGGVGLKLSSLRHVGRE